MSSIETLLKIDDFFKHIENTNELDLTKDLSWGYYFSNSNKAGLEKMKNILLFEEDYSFAEIVKMQDDNKFYLHMEKIEKHTKDSLLERSRLLNNIAKKYNVDSYDGFDAEYYIN